MNTRMSYLLFLLASMILIPFRIYQLLASIDPTTGFSESQPHNMILYGILAVVFLFVLIAVYFNKKLYIPKEISKNAWTPWILLLAAIAMVYKSLTMISDFSKAITPFLATFQIIYIVLGFAAGFALAVYAVMSLRAESTCKPPLVTSILIILYAVVLLFYGFMTNNTILPISQTFLTILFWCSAVWFIFGACAYLSGFEVEKSYRTTVTFGITTALIGLIVTVPTYFTGIFESMEYFAWSDPEKFLILPITLAALVISYSFAVTKKKKAIPDALVREPEDH